VETVPTAGLSDQVTVVSVVPLTLAVNCWVWEGVRETLVGVSVTATATRVMVALADLVVSAALVAVTVTVWELVLVLGAV